MASISEIIPFYVVDDDEQMVESLKTIITKLFPNSLVYKSFDGVEGWEQISKMEEPGVIICDFDMPGINGLQLLKKVRSSKKHKDFYFMLMIPPGNKELKLKAAQGAADDVIDKPFALEDLIIKMRSAGKLVGYQNLDNKNRESIKKMTEQIKKDNENMIDLISTIQNTRLGQKAGVINRISEAAEFIVRQMSKDLAEIEAVLKASEICHSAKIFLPDNLMDRPVMQDGTPLNKTMEDVPGYTKIIVNKINAFKLAGIILLHIYENFDGTGIPDKLLSYEIPLGSRILRVCIDYEAIINRPGKTAHSTMEDLRNGINRIYDFRVVAWYDQYLANITAAVRRTERPVGLDKLMINQIISRNVITLSGLNLMTSGTKLNEENIERIKQISTSDKIIGQIYIKNSVS
jgi:response regulator RpfG family c-di-GMP phosphodiesterase